MASDEEILEKMNDGSDTESEMAKLLEELNLDEVIDIPEYDGNNEEGTGAESNEASDSGVFDVSENEENATEEFLDMDEIDAILSDVSDIHPERKVDSKDLEERMAKYEEDPEAAEEALLNESEEEKAEETESAAEAAPEDENVADASEDVPETSDTGDAGESLESEVPDASDIPGDSAPLENGSEAIPDDSLSDDFLSNLEDVDALLAAVENKANEESERIQAEMNEKQAEADDDLDEINNIIQKSDNNEAVNDDLLKMIEDIEPKDEDESEGMFDEETPEEDDGKKGKKKKEKKKKEKKKKEKKSKKKGKGEEVSEETASESGDGEAKDKDMEFDSSDDKKKSGFLAKIFGFLFEEDEEEGEGEKQGEVGAEEADPKDKKGGKKKGKKDKKGKGKKNADDNAAIEAELDEEDKKSGKKEKKKKPKDKKPKKEKPVQEEEETKSSIKKPGMIVSALFCLTILGIVLILGMAGSKIMAVREARNAYYLGDYATASNKLYGIKRNSSDELIYLKSSLLYKLELYEDKADAYEITGEEMKYLDALFETYSVCTDSLSKAEELSITKEVNAFRDKIASRISDEYGVTAEQIDEICQMKPVYYTIAVENLVAGRKYDSFMDEYNPANAEGKNTEEAGPEEEEPENDLPELEDMLPEEELINNGSED
ncbi:MAG: hypothetical protein K5776_05290 [Lachnospiraceae bacterium]|nr:hypothetical protein [Lachnospiraceae bacterium]